MGKVEIPENEIQDATVFVDDYTGSGYGQDCAAVTETIKDVMIQYGVPLDSTYTGKAFFGMRQYLQENQIAGKKREAGADCFPGMQPL